MRRTWLRGRENVHKRYLIHVAGHNLGLLMRLLIGAGTPKEAVARGWYFFVLLRTTDGATYAAILEVFVENSAGPALIVFTTDCDHRLDGTTTSSTGCYVACRELAGRDASPSAAIIDSQSVKSAEKGGAALTRRAMTAARRSEARSVMSWSTPKACCSRPSSMQRTFRTAMVAFCSWPPCLACILSCSSYTPTVDIKGRSSRAAYAGSCARSTWRS